MSGTSPLYENGEEPASERRIDAKSTHRPTLGKCRLDGGGGHIVSTREKPSPLFGGKHRPPPQERMESSPPPRRRNHPSTNGRGIRAPRRVAIISPDVAPAWGGDLLKYQNITTPAQVEGNANQIREENLGDGRTLHREGVSSQRRTGKKTPFHLERNII